MSDSRFSIIYFRDDEKLSHLCHVHPSLPRFTIFYEIHSTTCHTFSFDKLDFSVPILALMGQENYPLQIHFTLPTYKCIRGHEKFQLLLVSFHFSINLIANKTETNNISRFKSSREPTHNSRQQAKNYLRHFKYPCHSTNVTLQM